MNLFKKAFELCKKCRGCATLIKSIFKESNKVETSDSFTGGVEKVNPLTIELSSTTTTKGFEKTMNLQAVNELSEEKKMKGSSMNAEFVNPKEDITWKSKAVFIK